MKKCWVIYVGEKAEGNFNIGFEKGIWGHKRIFNGVGIKNIQKGDIVFFVQHLQKLKGAIGNNEKNGFPRVPAEELFGVIKSLSKCEVTSNYYESTDEVWSDDIYPHRYDFKVLEQHKNINFGLEFFERCFVESVRSSLLKKGSPIEANMLDDSNIFNQTEIADMEVEEGQLVYKTHLRRERNSDIVIRKKELALDLYGSLSCEVCHFNFTDVYGIRGKDYIECHHKNPLSDTKVGVKTKLDDLALLCANCHRVIHRYKPWITIDKLRSLISA
ncbi:HNH endonuclease [Moritella sp. F3]|uniref:HNH endonuclease n=1 Tax=Moritella sp. F3 TaxID=2718882 RepID=UPI0018E0D5E5|nr:HNH endonuclease [Moritella sp. F3]GIC75999.1 hypothetical protein FMO001_07260 [Moritella sp. F1]GIC81538.1 hypothetical protein FMO003_18190 [Moritella sp. F3]